MKPGLGLGGRLSGNHMYADMSSIMEEKEDINEINFLMQGFKQ